MARLVHPGSRHRRTHGLSTSRVEPNEPNALLVASQTMPAIQHHGTGRSCGTVVCIRFPIGVLAKTTSPRSWLTGSHHYHRRSISSSSSKRRRQRRMRRRGCRGMLSYRWAALCCLRCGGKWRHSFRRMFRRVSRGTPRLRGCEGRRVTGPWTWLRTESTNVIFCLFRAAQQIMRAYRMGQCS